MTSHVAVADGIQVINPAIVLELGRVRGSWFVRRGGERQTATEQQNNGEPGWQ
jgi:hypothetical protein